MTDRERLLEILNKPIFPHENVDPLEAVADYLLDNGVAFAKDTNVPSWIPVSERLPEIDTDVLMYFTDDGNMVAGFLFDTDEDTTMWSAYSDGGYYTDCDYVPTHWMPLPEPPK